MRDRYCYQIDVDFTHSRLHYSSVGSLLMMAKAQHVVSSYGHEAVFLIINCGMFISVCAYIRLITANRDSAAATIDHRGSRSDCYFVCVSSLSPYPVQSQDNCTGYLLIYHHVLAAHTFFGLLTVCAFFLLWPARLLAPRSFLRL
ncbi:Uncharacterised protein [Yokenella regensburgei]|uniref:Uncharacterized protein n=1 Tax=Yokenella regensburgei TaxID=158877 RepID=A0AB38FUR1_9ENTR|nr:Uncharacterised protein [Yokenella regensburgei]SQB02218.1 Uncharacterised protein [Yokenella regensburgei]SUQ07481.1 Uncharacterised protein [Yokenella regensburgei]